MALNWEYLDSEVEKQRLIDAADEGEEAQRLLSIAESACQEAEARADDTEKLVAELLEACKGLVVALRIQAYLARSAGGDIAVHAGNGAAWHKARAAIAKAEGKEA